MDLLIDDGEKVIPIEVKVEENFRVKSLKMYREKICSVSLCQNIIYDRLQKRK